MGFAHKNAGRIEFANKAMALLISFALVFSNIPVTTSYAEEGGADSTDLGVLTSETVNEPSDTEGMDGQVLEDEPSSSEEQEAVGTSAENEDHSKDETAEASDNEVDSKADVENTGLKSDCAEFDESGEDEGSAADSKSNVDADIQVETDTISGEPKSQSSYSFADSETRIQVNLTTSNEGLRAQLESAALNVKSNINESIDDDAYSAVGTDVAASLGVEADFDVYVLTICNNDNDVSVEKSDGTSIEVCINRDSQDVEFYCLDESTSSLTSLKGQWEGQSFQAQLDKLGSIVAVPKSSSDVMPLADGGADDVAGGEQACYNSTANLSAAFSLMGAAYLNKSQDAEDTGTDSARVAANASAVAGDGEVVLTVPLDPEFVQGGISVSSLGTCANAEGELSEDGLTATFRLKDASGTYEFTGGSASYSVFDSATSLTLTATIPDEVAQAAFGSGDYSAADSVDAGARAATANLYAIDNGNIVYLGTLAPSGVAQEVAGTLNADGSISNGARLFSYCDGSVSVDVWLDETVTVNGTGEEVGGSTWTVNNDNSGYYARFSLGNLTGKYDFTNVSVSKGDTTYDAVYLRVDLANTQAYYPSNTAPYSGNTSLEPGTYTVTANFFVPGEYNPILVGFNAFMGSADFPPTTPVSGSGTLTVAEDGTVTLDIPILCRAFLLKSIGSSNSNSGAKVVNYSWEDETLEMFSNSTTGYITNLTFQLDDLSTGFYVFDDCHEYPLPIGQDWYLPMYLSVDLANATAADATSDSYEIDLADESGLLSLKLTTADKELAEQAQAATLSIGQISEGSDYDNAKAYLAENITGGEAPFVMYSYSVTTAQSSALDLSQFDSATFVLGDAAKSYFANSKDQLYGVYFYFDYANDGLTRFEGSEYTGGSRNWSEVVVDWPASKPEGTVVVAYGATKRAMKGSISLIDAATSVSVLGDVMDYTSTIYNTSGLFEYDLLVDSDTSGSRADQVRALLKDSGGEPYESYSVKAYAPAIVRTEDGGEKQIWGWDDSYDSYSYSMPVSSSDATVYLVTVDSEGNATTTLAGDVACVSSVGVQNGQATVTWKSPGKYAAWKTLYELFHELYRGATGDTDGQTYAYYAVVCNDAADKIVDAPVAASNLTYNGSVQVGVAAGEGYTLTGETSATDAGTYVATAKLNDGYVWSDGSKDDKTIEWSIAKAKLTATYSGEQVMHGSTPSYSVGVTGLVNGETVLTAAELTLPAIAESDKPAASELVSGFSKKLTPSGGSAKNYEFEYVGGTLQIVAAAGELAAGTYTVSANLYVPGDLNKVLGKNAYLTNSSTPLTDGNAPLTPVTDNATLVVGEDGSLTLELDVVNPVFTLQKIGGGSNAQATVTDYGDSLGASGDTYKKRISKLSITLENTSGTYVFSDCLEYPTLLSQEWTVPLTLEVDFSNVDKADPTPEPTPEPGKKVSVAEPVARTGLTYSGKVQTGVSEKAGYTLVGNTATAAGTYIATATLKDGYVWADGSTDAKKVTWTIGKAALLAVYEGETVEEGQTPSYAVTVNGFVNGENADTAAGYSAPSIADKPASLQGGQSYTLTPAGGAADNYALTYVSGTLKVTKADSGSGDSGNNGNNGSGTNSGTTGGSTAGNVDNSDGSYRLTAGTYTVTANLWLSDRASTGLPLMPYLTSGDFPPMYPVTENATLTVDSSGHATVRVPISIQSKVMTVSSISGLDITSTEYSGGYVSAITVDLGTITDMSGVITQSCTANIVMGSLASTISGITGSHSWPATFQVVFTGVPVSGNSGSSYDWTSVVSGASSTASGTLAAGVGALAAEGTGASADMGFLAVATKASKACVLGAAAGELEAGDQLRTASAYGRTGASKTIEALDPDASNGTSSTAALALAAAMSGGELTLMTDTATSMSAAFLGASATETKE